MRTKQALSILGIMGVLTFATSAMAATLVNYTFEDFPGGTRAANWAAAYSGTVANQYTKEISPNVHEGTYAQGLKPQTVNGAWTAIYQGFDTNEGDALTLQGWFYPTSAATYTTVNVGTNTTGDRPASWLYHSLDYPNFLRNAWNQTTKMEWNATSTTTYVWMENYALRSGSTTLRLDDFTWAHAYVPPVPGLSNPQATSIDVDVDPGQNSGNALAEFAISIGGGGFTLGTDFVQADGSILGATAWQTDNLWGSQTVNLPGNPADYQFAVMARYSNIHTMPTYLGTPTPEPATLGFLALGGLALLRRRR